MLVKEDLAQWVLHALKKALSKDNIQKGFEVTGIFPLDPEALTLKMGPSEVYASREGKQHSQEERSPVGV